jgi:hypothetical protein
MYSIGMPLIDKAMCDTSDCYLYTAFWQLHAYVRSLLVQYTYRLEHVHYAIHCAVWFAAALSHTVICCCCSCLAVHVCFCMVCVCIICAMDYILYCTQYELLVRLLITAVILTLRCCCYSLTALQLYSSSTLQRCPTQICAHCTSGQSASLQQQPVQLVALPQLLVLVCEPHTACASLSAFELCRFCEERE